MHGLAPSPLVDFITFKSIENRVTRGAAKADCWFGRAVFSFRASHQWNSIPQSITESTSIKHHFKKCFNVLFLRVTPDRLMMIRSDLWIITING